MSQEKDITKKRSWKQLSLKDRFKIETLLAEKLTPNEIAKRIGRDRRTIEREIRKGTVLQVDKQWVISYTSYGYNVKQVIKNVWKNKKTKQSRKSKH